MEDCEMNEYNFNLRTPVLIIKRIQLSLGCGIMELERRPCSEGPTAFFILWSGRHLSVHFFDLENYAPFLRHLEFW